MAKRERDKGKNSNAKTIWTIVIIVVIALATFLVLKSTYLQESPELSPQFQGGQAKDLPVVSAPEFIGISCKDTDGLDIWTRGCLTSYDAPLCGGNKREYGDFCSGGFVNGPRSGRQDVIERICTKQDENDKTIVCDKSTGCCKNQDQKNIDCMEQCEERCRDIRARRTGYTTCEVDRRNSGCFETTIPCNDKEIVSAKCRCELIVRDSF